MVKNVLDLKSSLDGNRIKQGDLSVMSFYLKDSNNDNLNLQDLDATAYLSTKGNKVVYKYKTYVKNDNGESYIDFKIENIIPSDTYVLEVLVDNKYIFPSDNTKEIIVTPSVIGKALEQLYVPNLLGDIINYAKSNSMIDTRLTIEQVDVNSQGDKIITFSDGSSITIPKGQDGKDGKSFTPSDLTDEDYKKIMDYAISHEYFNQELIDTSKIEVGNEEPIDKTKIWIDTSGGNK